MVGRRADERPTAERTGVDLHEPKVIEYRFKAAVLGLPDRPSVIEVGDTVSLRHGDAEGCTVIAKHNGWLWVCYPDGVHVSWIDDGSLTLVSKGVHHMSADEVRKGTLDCRHCGLPLYRVTSTWGTDSGWRHPSGDTHCPKGSTAEAER
jgi:hypothetical protein